MSKAIVRKTFLCKPTDLSSLITYLSAKPIVTFDHLDNHKVRNVKHFGYILTSRTNHYDKVVIYWDDGTRISTYRPNVDITYEEIYFQIRKCRYYYGIKL